MYLVNKQCVNIEPLCMWRHTTLLLEAIYVTRLTTKLTNFVAEV